jgi:hypothetical protein
MEATMDPLHCWTRPLQNQNLGQGVLLHASPCEPAETATSTQQVVELSVNVVTENVLTEDVATQDVATEDVATVDVVTVDVVTEDVVKEDVVTNDVAIEDVATKTGGDPVVTPIEVAFVETENDVA